MDESVEGPMQSVVIHFEGGELNPNLILQTKIKNENHSEKKKSRLKSYTLKQNQKGTKKLGEQ